MDAGLDGYGGRVLVVAKSPGNLAAPGAAARGYDAAWLTPLLTEPDAAEPLLSYPGAQFVVIGLSDPYFSQDVFDALPGERLLVPGDHILRVPGDAGAMVASHDRFVRTFDAWLITLQPQQPTRNGNARIQLRSARIVTCVLPSLRALAAISTPV